MRRIFLPLVLIVICVPGLARAGQPHHYNGYFEASTDQTPIMWQAYTPDPDVWGPGPYPVVVDYSGYEPATTFFDGLKDTFLNQGYAVAGVNIRGTGCSGGKFDYFEHVEWQDGYDAIEFLADQTKNPWSNGHIAMVGKSYPGITQMYVASLRPPHLDAIVPGAFFGDLYRDVPYPGGILNSVFAAGWSFGSQPANSFDQWSSGVENGDQTCIRSQVDHAQNPVTNPFVTAMSHPFDDAIYHQRSNIYYDDQIQVPVLAEIAWQDEEVGSRGLDILTHLHVPWRAVVTNGDHGEYYGDFVKPEIFRFLSYYVKQQVPSGDACAKSTYSESLACYQSEPRLLENFDNGPNRAPTFQHRWDSWPVTNDVYRLQLHEGGVLDQAPHGDSEAPTQYVYQFPLGSNSYGNSDGLPLVGGQVPFTDFWQQRPPANTVATFTSAPFSADTMLIGTASADLWISSTAPDTDLEVMLTEIRPNGAGGYNEEYVQKGWLRASHRILDDTLSTPLRPYQTHQLGDFAPLIPGQPTKVRVEIFPFGQLFRAGTRLRLTIEAPTTLPELWGFAAEPQPALNQIYTDSAHPSSLALPLANVPAESIGVPERACGTIRNQPCRSEPTS
ncbi:MAG: CocE/NonD family hydrolase [Actinomycetota bacterium]